MVNRTDQLLRLQGDDAVVAEIMEVYGEAAEVHEQSLIAMGQQALGASAAVASTEVVVNLTLDLSSSGTHS